MTPSERRSCTVTFPNDLEIVATRDFDAPIDLVFDVLTQPEHLRKTIAPFGETVTELSIDLREGGTYRYVFVPEGGPECAFNGTFLELQRPARIAATWHFEGWPGVEAVETQTLHEHDGVTTMQWSLAFRDQAGRDRMSSTDGIEANLQHIDDLLQSLQGNT